MAKKNKLNACVHLTYRINAIMPRIKRRASLKVLYCSAVNTFVTTFIAEETDTDCFFVRGWIVFSACVNSPCKSYLVFTSSLCGSQFYQECVFSSSQAGNSFMSYFLCALADLKIKQLVASLVLLIRKGGDSCLE